MKRGLCLLNIAPVTNGPEHFYQRMAEELSRYGIPLEKKTNDGSLIYIKENGDVVNNLGAYDFILYLDKDKYLSSLLEKCGYRLFNSSQAIRLCDDKMLTHIFLSQEGIKMPKTIAAPLNYGTALPMAFLETITNLLPFPLVAKENFGSLGKNVFLIKNMDELVEFEQKHLQIPHLYQEFISSSYGFDYRVIVVGGKVCAAMKRVNNHDWRSNIAQKGKGEKATLDVDYIEMAEKAARTLQLDYCGVDLLSGPKGEPILCEVNSNAFLSGIEKVSGINVAAEYVKEIVSKMSIK